MWHPQGGAFELKQATWAYKQAKESPAAKADPLLREALEQEDIRHWFAHMPWRPGFSPLRHAPAYEDYLFDQWGRGCFDAYWQQLGICADHYRSNIPDIPVLHMSSWYDAYVSSTLDNFAAFVANGKAPQRLVMALGCMATATLATAAMPSLAQPPLSMGKWRRIGCPVVLSGL